MLHDRKKLCIIKSKQGTHRSGLDAAAGNLLRCSFVKEEKGEHRNEEKPIYPAQRMPVTQYVQYLFIFCICGNNK